MLAAKFDVDTSRLSYDRDARTLSMTVLPLVPYYDEAAILAHGWGVMAGCPELARLSVTVSMEDEEIIVTSRSEMRRAA